MSALVTLPTIASESSESGGDQNYSHGNDDQPWVQTTTGPAATPAINQLQREPGVCR